MVTSDSLAALLTGTASVSGRVLMSAAADPVSSCVRGHRGHPVLTQPRGYRTGRREIAGAVRGVQIWTGRRDHSAGWSVGEGRSCPRWERAGAVRGVQIWTGSATVEESLSRTVSAGERCSNTLTPRKSISLVPDRDVNGLDFATPPPPPSFSDDISLKWRFYRGK